MRQRTCIFLNPLSRVEKNEPATNPITRTGESGYHRIRWCSEFESSLLPNNNNPIWRHDSNNRANLSPLLCALWRMLWTHFIAEEPWVVEWIRIPLDACGRANTIWIRYVWKGKFFKVADSKISRYVWTGPITRQKHATCFLFVKVYMTQFFFHSGR